MSELFDCVPTTYHENLEYRLKLRVRAEKDAGYRRACMQACKQDVLFFFSAWTWLYEPRPKIVDGKKQSHVIPFIPWPHQVPVIREIDRLLGFEDIGLEKSRGEGASWIGTLFAVRDWLFIDMAAVGLVSRNEKAADNPDDPDSLFWKIDWELTKLPKWMLPDEWKRSLNDHTLKNCRSGATITAYSATGDVASGGRKRWFLKDELAKFKPGEDRNAMASTQHVTNSRLIVSTPKGRTGVYYEIMHEVSSMAKLVLDWRDNPSKNRGLYRMDKGVPVAVDTVKNPLPKNYDPVDEAISAMLARLKQKGYDLEGLTRSPWYDHECDRPGATPQTIAQELDRDYGGSVHRVFREDFFKQAEAHVRPPTARGVLSYSGEDLVPAFEKDSTGDLMVWLNLDVNNRPPHKMYTLGVDPSYGLGGAYTNNSAVVAIDQSSLEQVAEFAVHTMPPEDFAEFCIALAKWFHNAYLIFEANGPGFGFAKRILTRGYGNVYHRNDEMKVSKKKLRKIGWWSSPDTKRIIIGEFSRSVRMAELKLHSDSLVKECWQYVVINGEIRNASEASSSDDLSKKHSHADRVIAAALALHGLRDRPVAVNKDSEAPPGDKAPRGTMAWREKHHRELREKQDDPWDHRTTDELTGGEASWREHDEFV